MKLVEALGQAMRSAVAAAAARQLSESPAQARRKPATDGSMPELFLKPTCKPCVAAAYVATNSAMIQKKMREFATAWRKGKL